MRMMYAPRSSSVRSAHSSRLCHFSLPKTRLTVFSPTKWPIQNEMLSPTIAPAAAERMTSQQYEVAGARQVAAEDDERLAGDEREERVDDRDGEDDEVAPPLAGDPLGEAVEVEPVGHPRHLLSRG